MAVGGNKLRIFAQTISLDAWRTPFDGRSGEADLYIDVVFDEQGRVGGEGAPVRFRLSLKRAEVHVMRDSENIIEIRSSSVLRANLPEPTKARRVTEGKSQIKGELGGEVSPTSAELAVRAKVGGSLSVTNTLEQTESISAMEVIHWRTDNGYSFRIKPRAGRLKGYPWEAKAALLKLRDTHANRKHGETPEIRVEIHCLKEDLLIEQVEFTDTTLPRWPGLERKKQIAVEQYIKDQLARSGLRCGDLSDPFSPITLADVVPSIEP